MITSIPTACAACCPLTATHSSQLTSQSSLQPSLRTAYHAQRTVPQPHQPICRLTRARALAIHHHLVAVPISTPDKLGGDISRSKLEAFAAAAFLRVLGGSVARCGADALRLRAKLEEAHEELRKVVSFLGDTGGGGGTSHRAQEQLRAIGDFVASFEKAEKDNARETRLADTLRKLQRVRGQLPEKTASLPLVTNRTRSEPLCPPLSNLKLDGHAAWQETGVGTPDSSTPFITAYATHATQPLARWGASSGSCGLQAAGDALNELPLLRRSLSQPPVVHLCDARNSQSAHAEADPVANSDTKWHRRSQCMTRVQAPLPALFDSGEYF